MVDERHGCQRLSARKAQLNLARTVETFPPPPPIDLHYFVMESSVFCHDLNQSRGVQGRDTHISLLSRHVPRSNNVGEEGRKFLTSTLTATMCITIWGILLNSGQNVSHSMPLKDVWKRYPRCLSSISSEYYIDWGRIETLPIGDKTPILTTRELPQTRTKILERQYDLFW